MSSSEEGGGQLSHADGEIPWAIVHQLVRHVLTASEQLGAQVAVALVDRWGRQLAFQRQPGTVITSSAVAVAKAFTACNFGAPTDHLLETISRHDQLELARLNPGLVFAGGGFPIRAEGRLVGGIGVSGASAEEDAELGLAALRSAGFDVDFAERP